MNPQNTVFDAKRLIGRKFNDPTVQADIKHWPFKVVDGPDHKPFIEGASDTSAALPLLLLVILRAFPTRSKVRLQTSYREGCHSHTPGLTRQIQARHINHGHSAQYSCRHPPAGAWHCNHQSSAPSIAAYRREKCNAN